MVAPARGGVGAQAGVREVGAATATTSLDNRVEHASMIVVTSANIYGRPGGKNC
jgi:hypothetical protein